jgi:hypothetical protein
MIVKTLWRLTAQAGVQEFKQFNKVEEQKTLPLSLFPQTRQQKNVGKKSEALLQ